MREKPEQRQKYQLCSQRSRGVAAKQRRRQNNKTPQASSGRQKCFYLLGRGASAVEVEAVGVRHDLVLEPVEDQRGAGGGRHFFLSNFCSKVEMLHGTTTNEGTDNSDDHTVMNIL